jgi:hypothetical protein
MISIRDLRFVCAQPATLYYAWQVEVMLNNFNSMGINLNLVDIVCWKQNGVVPDEWSKLATAYPARFFFYDDTRETRHYISSIRPNILKQHWEKYPELSLDAIFYHDCDIVFTKPPTEWITDIMIKDKRWYGSDTRWYIGHDYIRSKGEDILEAMCDIVGISKYEVESNELNAIGAQYLMKSIDYDFWNNVEKDSERLFKEITDLNNIKKSIQPSYHELQIWCADMWAVLWNGWKLGNHTVCHENFNFSWGTSTEEEYHKMNIMHNAGVTSPHDGLFYKAQYMHEMPYNKNLSIREGTASKKYWEWVELAAKQTNLI